MTRLIGKKESSPDAHDWVALIPSLPLLTLYPCTQLPMKTGHKTEKELREQMAGGTQIRNCSSTFLTNGKLLKGYMILSIMGEMQCMWLFSNDLQGSGSWRQCKDTLNARPFAAPVVQEAMSNIPLLLAQSNYTELTQERTGKKISLWCPLSRISNTRLYRHLCSIQALPNGKVKATEAAKALLKEIISGCGLPPHLQSDKQWTAICSKGHPTNFSGFGS